MIQFTMPARTPVSSTPAKRMSDRQDLAEEGGEVVRLSKRNLRSVLGRGWVRDCAYDGQPRPLRLDALVVALLTLSA